MCLTHRELIIKSSGGTRGAQSQPTARFLLCMLERALRNVCVIDAAVV